MIGITVLNNESIDKYKTYNPTYITLFGDSHTLCFVGSSLRNKYLYITYKNKNFIIKNASQDSVSISGLDKQSSKLSYNNTIRTNIDIKTSNYNMFKLGQVDVEYIYYYKIYKKHEIITKTEFYNDIITKYIKFLLSLNVNVIVCGINLPGFKTNNEIIQYLSYVTNISEYDLINKEITLQIKMKDALFFNNMLKQICLKFNIIYFDLIDETIKYIDDNIYIKDDFFEEGGIHYKGANGCAEVRLHDTENYINNEKYACTYHTFLKKLLDNLPE